jgi:DNA topoisomerase VI subunit B
MRGIEQRITTTHGSVLERVAFETSREIEFFSEKELQMQIGHGRALWPLALLKELIDNALDACETAKVSPHIEAVVEDAAFGVFDNGPGMPTDLITRSLDYLKRVSDKAFYVSPTRGQLGNALKTVWAAPFVANGERGCVEVWSQGWHHKVEVSLDRLSQRPAIKHNVEPDEFVKNGTFFKIHWPDLACSIQAEDEDDDDSQPDFSTKVKELVEGYAAFNPHASFTIGDAVFAATNPGWKKWKPYDPTAPSWYTPDTLRDLIAAYINLEREGGSVHTVREFVSEFRGISGTAKQKAATGDLSGTYLHDLVVDNNLDLNRVGKLLRSMVENSKAPEPQALGIIGKEHITTWMMRYTGVAEKSIKYTKRINVEDGLPYVLEAAFGIREQGERRMICGLNWSPTLVLPAEEISVLVGNMRIDEHDPVTVLLHIARPRFNFVDRGKTRLQL